MKAKIAFRNKHKIKWLPKSGTNGARWGKLVGDKIPNGVTMFTHNNPNKNGKSYKWTVFATFNDGKRDSVETTRRGFNEALEITLREIQ